MLRLLLIFSGLGLLTSAGHYFETSHHQIVVPRKLGSSTNDGNVLEMHVTYALKINRKTYTLHLEKQSFVDPHFLVYSYNKSGALYLDSSFRKGHCFYQGYAKEIPKSAVTLNTCSGLRGLLQLENVSYGIEPLESAAMYEHMLYQIKNNKIDFQPLEENYPMIQLVDQPYRIFVKSEKKADVLLKRILKIQIVMDKGLYDYMGSEAAIAVEKVVHLFGLINTMFSQLKVTFILTSLELWSDQNKILTNGDANELLQRFVAWKEKFLLQKSYNMAFLLIYKNYPNYVGATYNGMACDPKLAAGIALYPKKITSEAFSVVMAQLLGINLGLSYDDVYNCYCPGNTCIMNPQAVRSRGIKFFSSCSVDEFKRIVSQPEFECLQNQTVSKVVVHGRQAVCGNGIREGEEECDCGLPEKCEYKRCCNPETCTLISLAECGTGPCCDRKTCLISERGRICRKSKDECDFPEFCTGLSETCVPDTEAADLEPCSNNTAFCYWGMCADPTRQCVKLFGKFAKSSTYLCAEEVNFLADRFGNCGPKACPFRNTICGKIVCHWTHTQLVPTTAYDIQYTYLGGHICMSASLRNSTYSSGRDISYVANGTMCDQGKFCYGGNCVEILSHLNQREGNCRKETMCHGHGVCNNYGHCQCDPGYSPPACERTPSSPGGSIDDGYWVGLNDKIINLPIKNQRAARRKKGLLISFCVSLPLLILIAIIALKLKTMKFWKREGTVSEGSMPQDSNSNSSKSYTELK